MIASRMADAAFALTASIGCTPWEQAPESTLDALRKTDKAMYAAKADRKACAVNF
jgi:GGDEF domain-containing protein